MAFQEYSGNGLLVPNAPELDYGSLYDVMHEVRDVYVVDLVRYTSRLPKSYSSCLQPAPNGVYARGLLEPVLCFAPQNQYYTLSQYQTNRQQPNINSFEDFILSKEPVVDGRGNVLCPNPHFLRNHFQATCSFNYSAVYLAAITILEELRLLHRDTCPTTTINPELMCESHWVLPECYPEQFDSGENPDIGYLLDNVNNFIGRDHCAVYNLRLQNTTLYLEKGNDFRVIAYYESIFNNYEFERFEKFGF